MGTHAADLALDIGCTLGEGPTWWHGALWFVDIEAGVLHRFDPARREHHAHELGGRVGFAVPTERETWIVGRDASIAAWREGDATVETLHQVEDEDRCTRFNDGKCDPHGRLYAGTMHLKAEAGRGSLYRVQADGQADEVVANTTISNGLAWDESRGAMYFIDTAGGTIDRFDWDAETGSISGRTPIATPEGGGPDGMCIDREGYLWVAMWGGSRVARFNPETGSEVDSIAVPCPNPTSCCFGGEAFDELWITTARYGMSAEHVERYPTAGGVFVARPGVHGHPPTPMRAGTSETAFGGRDAD